MGKWIERRKKLVASETDEGVSSCQCGVSNSTDSHSPGSSGAEADFAPAVSAVSASADDKNEKRASIKDSSDSAESLIELGEQKVDKHERTDRYTSKNTPSRDVADCEDICRSPTDTTARDHLKHLLRIGWSEDSVLIKQFRKEHGL